MGTHRLKLSLHTHLFMFWCHQSFFKLCFIFTKGLLACGHFHCLSNYLCFQYFVFAVLYSWTSFSGFYCLCGCCCCMLIPPRLLALGLCVSLFKISTIWGRESLGCSLSCSWSPPFPRLGSLLLCLRFLSGLNDGFHSLKGQSNTSFHYHQESTCLCLQLLFPRKSFTQFLLDQSHRRSITKDILPFEIS